MTEPSRTVEGATTSDGSADQAELAVADRHAGRSRTHERPAGVDDATVKALGGLSEALEVVENARGYLYAFHRLSGMADLRLQEAVSELRDAGHAKEASFLQDVLVGRDVVRDMWTFEIVETYDDQYWSRFREAEEVVRRSVGGLPPHVFEAEMKAKEQGS